MPFISEQLRVLNNSNQRKIVNTDVCYFRRQHPLEKPAIPRKPKVSQVKQFILGKGGRSKSTPHLQQGREDEKISAELTASTDRIKDPEFASGTSTPLSKDSSADSLPRPIPKPRQFGKTGLAGRKSLGEECSLTSLYIRFL